MLSVKILSHDTIRSQNENHPYLIWRHNQTKEIAQAMLNLILTR
jgi:hypothetical protein